MGNKGFAVGVVGMGKSDALVSAIARMNVGNLESCTGCKKLRASWELASYNKNGEESSEGSEVEYKLCVTCKRKFNKKKAGLIHSGKEV